MAKVGRPRKKGNWEAIRADYEAGDMSANEIAQKWMIKASLIRTRASRENWATPNRIKKAANAFVDLVAPKMFEVAGGQAGSVADLQSHMSKTMDPQEYQAFVAEMAMAAVRSGLTNVKRPSNWRELATADTIARRAAGLDKTGASAVTLVRVTGAGGPVDVAVGVADGAE